MNLQNLQNSCKPWEFKNYFQMSLDEAIEYLADDELLEVTPEAFRIRKRILDTEGRGKQQKKAKELLEAV